MNTNRRHRLAIGLLCGSLVVGLGAAPRAYAGDRVDDSALRLGPRGANIQRVIDQAARSGLPTDGLASKVREGLAKGAPPDLILRAVERQARTLAEASALLREQRKAPASPALMRSVADARAAGITPEAARPLITSSADDARVVRAMEVLTDLALRGYPERGAGLLVRDVLERDPGSVAHIAGGLESIRRGQTVSRADAIEILERSLLASGNSLDAAVNRSLEGRAHAAAASGEKSGRGNDQSAAAASKKGMGMGQGMK